MSNKNQKYSKPFSHPRWNDPPIPKIIGEHEVTEEEEKRAEETLKKWEEGRKRYKEIVKNEK